jgi:nicotinate phosphoribosyltransferase
MASAYYKAGIHEEKATFDLFYRSVPKGWGYLVACGIDDAIEFINRYTLDDFAELYLNNKKIITKETALYLLFNMSKLKEHLVVHAVKEGTIIFPDEPVMTITGPRILCQLLETPLLNMINFQTLIASKASRIVNAANGKGVIEFGLRRAQGEDAAINGSRAAYIGGCIGTSNVEAGIKYNIPIIGTHAHSFVMSFSSELEAFRAYANTFPDNTTLLIDTYDTLNGAKNAIIVGKELEKSGHRLKAVRLDSGDLLKLSNQVRTILDSAGFSYVKIVASNDLNELKIDRLIKYGAKIDIFGVGTELITSKPESALSGVYKLVEDIHGDKVKLSQDKKTMPGLKQVVRDNKYDIVYCLEEIDRQTRNLHDIDLLERVDIYLHEPKKLSEIRDKVKKDIKALPNELKQIEVSIKDVENKVAFSKKLIERMEVATKKVMIENK